MHAKSYQELDLRAALSRKGDYVEACRELATIIREGFAAFPKPLQALILEDVFISFRFLPELETIRQLSAANLVLQASESVFPRQKKSQALSKFRHAAVLQRRRCKNVEAEEGQLQLSMDLLFHIFGFLDVQSLACAAVVSRFWNAAAKDERLWHAQFMYHFGRLDLNLHYPCLSQFMPPEKLVREPGTLTQVCWKKAFRLVQRGHPLFLSNRAYCTVCKAILWLEESKYGSFPKCSASEDHALKPITPLQISHYVMTKSVTSSSESDSESDCEDDDEEEDTGRLNRKFSKLWALPKLS